MKAVQFEIKDCFQDFEGNIHAIFVNEVLTCFFPIYVTGDYSGLLLKYFRGEWADEDKIFLDFINNSWKTLGFTVKSIVFDYQGGGHVYLLPTITYVQDQIKERSIYVTTFIPINAALIISSVFKSPIFFTDRCQSVLKKRSLESLESYIKSFQSKERRGEP